MLFSAFHEFAHKLRTDSPEAFRKLTESVTALADKGKYSKWQTRYNAKYRKAGYAELDEEALAEEFISDVVGSFGAEEDFLKELAGQDKSVLERFLDWIEALRKALLGDYKPEARKVIDKELDRVRREVLAALRAAGTDLADKSDESDGAETEAVPETGGVVTVKFITDYMKRFGNILSSDNIKLMFRDRGYNPHDEESIRAFHKQTGPMIGKMFDIFLRRKGRGNGTVVFTGGGNGSGKSTVLSGDISRNADFVMDSAMVNFSAARDSIQKVIDNGQVPVLAFVYRSPGDAWFNGVLKRNQSEDGHTVPKSTFANTHSIARENFFKLLDEFGGKVQYIIWETKDNGTSVISLDELKAKPVYTKEQILEIINGKANSDERGTGGVHESSQRGGSALGMSSRGESSPGRPEDRKEENGGAERETAADSDRLSGRGDERKAVTEELSSGRNTRKELAAQVHTIDDYCVLVMRNPGLDASAKKDLLKRFALDQKMTLKEAEELLEYTCVQSAREIASDNSLTEREKYNLIVKMYEDMPLLNMRTSTSIENQAYSTPLPLAYMLGRAVLRGANRIYEPTAGNGALVLTAEPGKVHANEIETGRLSALRESGFAVTSHDAAEYVPEEKSDAVIMNPPFGRLKEKWEFEGTVLWKLEHLIALNALKTLTPDGRAAMILGAADKLTSKVNKSEKPFLNYLYDHFNIADSFEVSGELYKKQGAGYPVRVIILNGRKEKSDFSDKFSETPVERLADWGSIYERLKGVEDEINQQRVSAETGLRENAGSGVASDVAGRRDSADGAGAGEKTAVADRGTDPSVHRGEPSGRSEAGDGAGAGGASGASVRGVGESGGLGGRSASDHGSSVRTEDGGGASGVAEEDGSGRDGGHRSVHAGGGEDVRSVGGEAAEGKYEIGNMK